MPSDSDGLRSPTSGDLSDGVATPPEQRDVKPSGIGALRSPTPPDAPAEKPVKPPSLERKPSDIGALRSPIRPTHPDAAEETQPVPVPPRSGLIAKGHSLSKAILSPDDADPNKLPENPQAALALLRGKMEVVANEFAQGKINRAQFNAIYGRYGEQRTIIEKLIERDPGSSAWKQAAAPGHTSFLRQHFEARLLYYIVFQHHQPAPLTMGGKQQFEIERITSVLKALWGMTNRPKVGLARKDMGNGYWLVLALGEFAVTLAMYQLEPSVAQTNLVRDLHNDFERANKKSLSTGTRTLDRFVFPQRALAEGTLS
jgi:hypothetical protein